jgi:hypothetical protein
LPKPQLRDVRQKVEWSIYESAVDFIDYKNKCDAAARDAIRCYDQLPDNIDSWRQLLIAYLPEGHDLRPAIILLPPYEYSSEEESKEHGSLAQAATGPVPSAAPTGLAANQASTSKTFVQESTPQDQALDVDTAVVPNTSSSWVVGADNRTATSGVSVTPISLVDETMGVGDLLVSAKHDPSDLLNAIFGEADVDMVDDLDVTKEPSQVSATRGSPTNRSHSVAYLPQSAASQLEQSYSFEPRNGPSNDLFRPDVTDSDVRTSAQAEPVALVAQLWQPISSTNRHDVTERGAGNIIRRRDQKNSPGRQQLYGYRWSPWTSKERRRVAQDPFYRDSLDVSLEQLSSRILNDDEAAVHDASGSDTTESDSNESDTSEESDPTQSKTTASDASGESDTAGADASTSTSISDLPSSHWFATDGTITTKSMVDVQALISEANKLRKND